MDFAMKNYEIGNYLPCIYTQIIFYFMDDTF